MVRQLDERAASMYQQCSRTCKEHLGIVANRRSTPDMASAGTAPFVKSFACMCRPSPSLSAPILHHALISCADDMLSTSCLTDELDVALKTWSLRLRLLPRTGKDKRRYRLVVQTSEFFAEPWCRVNADLRSFTLDIFLPQVCQRLPCFCTLIGIFFWPSCKGKCPPRHTHRAMQLTCHF